MRPKVRSAIANDLSKDGATGADHIINTPQQHSPKRESLSDLDILLTLLKSGRITRKDYVVYKILHNRQLTATSNVILSDFADKRPLPNATSKVFNTPELLEMILLRLKPAHFLTKAQLTCRGFKRSMDSSPAFRRCMTVATRGIDPDWDFTWSIAPKCMSFHYNVTGRVVFKLDFTNLSFERYRAIESFRKLCVSDALPQKFQVLWLDDSTSPGQMIRIHTEECENIAFGQIFDAVAARIPAGRTVGDSALFLSADHKACRVSF